MAGRRSRRRAVGRALETLARRATEWAGSAWAFGCAVAVVAVWLVTGPLYRFSDTWQLVINTGTTVVTFLMVFLLQRAQNKDALAAHLKLTEIVAAPEGASHRRINVEDLAEDEIRLRHQHDRRLVEIARHEEALTRSHSIEEAEIRYRIKRRREAQLAAALGAASGEPPAAAAAAPAP